MQTPPPLRSAQHSWLESSSARDAGRFSMLAAGSLLILFGLSGISIKAENESGSDSGTNLFAEISRSEAKTQLGLGAAIAGFALTISSSKRKDDE